MVFRSGEKQTRLELPCQAKSCKDTNFGKHDLLIIQIFYKFADIGIESAALLRKVFHPFYMINSRTFIAIGIDTTCIEFHNNKIVPDTIGQYP